MNHLPRVGDILTFTSAEGHGVPCRAFVRVKSVHPPGLIRAVPVRYFEGEEHLKRGLKPAADGVAYFLVNISLCEPFNIVEEIGKLDDGG